MKWVVGFVVAVLFAPGCTGSRAGGPGPGLERALDARGGAEQREATAALHRRDVIRGVLARTVKLHVYDGKELARAASGVVVGAERTSRGAQSFVITNAHLLEPDDIRSPSFTIVTELGGDVVELTADPVALGSVPDMDLALMRVRGVLLEPAELAGDDEVEPGETVIVASAPFGKSISLSGGMVSRVEIDRHTLRPTLLKTDAAVGYGGSGGGVFSLETGKLIALVEGYRTTKVGIEVAEHQYTFDMPVPGETFAAPSAKLRAFLEGHGLARILPAVGSPAAVR